MTDETQKQANVPDFYVDRVRSSISSFGTALSFGISDAHPETPDESSISELVTIRMSLEHLKVMLILMKRQLKEFEKTNDFEVALPKDVTARLGLEEETW